MIKIPQGGFTLAQMCQLCKDHAVTFHIGIGADDIPSMRTIIWIVVAGKKGGQDVNESFRCEIHPMNPRMNLEVSHLLVQHIEKISNKKGRIHTL